jgi:hypothetical protein
MNNRTHLKQPHAPALALAGVLAAALACALLLGACSTPQAYAATQQMQKNECQKLQDREERMRCEKQASLSYERYKAEAEKAKP